MKRTWATVLATLVFVFALSYGVSLLVPLFDRDITYSETNCLTEQVTSQMKDYEIARLYRDGNATVAVKVAGNGQNSLGSGVCVASNGYTTAIKGGDGANLVAMAGSYIVTNHHVIDVGTTNYSSLNITLVTETEETPSCSVLWANENLDIAILYTDYNLNYVTMKDVIINPAANERFDIQPIFTIGCPLDERDYLNRFTNGFIGTNDTLSMYTTDTKNGVEVMSNMYEDVVDITAGISPGNSGGGCFDEHGFLIGLNTLGTSETLTGGNQMNAIVPIYPVMQVLDRLIENKEYDGNNIIYTPDYIGIYGIDSYESSVAGEITVNGKYYLNGQLYNTTYYSAAFAFTDKGFYILKNTSISDFKKVSAGGVVRKCYDGNGQAWQIDDRNDFIYFLLNVEEGENIKIEFSTGNSVSFAA